MINISDFDTDFKGRKFKDNLNIEYVIVGYGDNGSNGNPYLVGLAGDGSLRTTLFKNVTFIP
jgi:hypothetical protein